MGRLLVVLLLLSLPAAAQLKERDEKTEPPGALVEEDEDIVAPTEYVFNPIQANKDLKIGDFYAKKGSHRAAVGRYLEATKWNPGLAEAYWKLARSREKLNQHAQSLEAYQKYLELEADGKHAREARKRVSEIEAQREKLPLTEQAAPGQEPAGEEAPARDEVPQKPQP